MKKIFAERVISNDHQGIVTIYESVDEIKTHLSGIINEEEMEYSIKNLKTPSKCFDGIMIKSDMEAIALYSNIDKYTVLDTISHKNVSDKFNSGNNVWCTIGGLIHQGVVVDLYSDCRINLDELPEPVVPMFINGIRKIKLVRESNVSSEEIIDKDKALAELEETYKKVWIEALEAYAEIEAVKAKIEYFNQSFSIMTQAGDFIPNSPSDLDPLIEAAEEELEIAKFNKAELDGTLLEITEAQMELKK